MSLELWTKVDQYLEEKFASDDSILTQVLVNSVAAGMPPHNVSATQGKFLQLIAQIINAKTILEIGTLGAYSTILLGRALQEDGRLVSLEMNSEWIKLLKKILPSQNYQARWIYARVWH